MKLNKLAYMLCLALAVGSASCNNSEDEWKQDANTSANTVVEFSAAEVSVKENRGAFKVPVVCTGEQNGRVTITVAVEPVSGVEKTEEAKEGVNYHVTSFNVNIDKEDQSAWVDFATIDDDVINDPRLFKVTITEAKGATIGEKSSCIVRLKDNDADVYDKLTGAWEMTVYQRLFGRNNPITWKVTIVTPEEDDASYGKELYITGLNGQSIAQCTLNYYFDEVTKVGHVAIPAGCLVAEGVNFTGLGVADVYLDYYDGGFVPNGVEVNGTWSQDLKKITFDSGKFVAGIYSSAGARLGNWFGMEDIVLTRK